jgi:hypothetical protein
MSQSARVRFNKNDFELSETIGGFTSTISRWGGTAKPAPATVPPAGRQRRGSAEGCRPGASRGARPPNLARRGEIATKTQELRPISNCDALPNHVLLLPRFGAPPTCVAAALCGSITMMLAREVGALKNTTRRFSMHLMVAGKPHHSSGTFHSHHIGVSKGKLRI